MAKLNDYTHVLLDGAVKVYKRGNSKRWQATFQIDQHWIRISTGKPDLEDAKAVAREQYLDYKFRAKHDLPVVTKRFEDVARLSIVDMQRQLDAGAGRKVFKDYIKAIDKYFIPFFGKTFITNIDHDRIQAFNAWRVEQIGRAPKASTLNTHNSAMNMPGIGPITASAIVATIGDAKQFRTGRDLAAWLGLTPLNKSSGGKERLGKITKKGDRYIRNLLVVGMTSRAVKAKRSPEKVDLWTAKIIADKPFRLATTAMANKAARIIWAMLTKKQEYRQPAF